MEFEGEKLLSKIYNDLHTKDIVIKSSLVKDGKYLKIKKYMDRLEKVNNLANNKNRKDLLYELYYKKYININLSIEDIENQKNSLKNWLDYLIDENTKYPMWAKYWIFQGMLKMGTYNEQTETYMKRNNKTKAPFIDVVPEAISKSIEQVNEKNNNFSDIYTKNLKEFKKNKRENASNDGIWIKYNYGSKEDAKKLFDSLQGKNTGWCTASSLEYATKQVCGEEMISEIYSYPGGDFYVFYTKDNNGEYNMPRIAIRMNGTKSIGEIRGIDESQNIEDGLEPIVEAKINTLDIYDKDKYMKTIDECKKLTQLNKKVLNTEINENELNFLFKNKSKMGFGWQENPKIKKIKSKIKIKDKDYLIDLIKDNPKNYEYACDDLKEDFDVVLTLIQTKPSYYSELSEHLKDDERLFKSIGTKYSYIYDYTSDRIKNNEDCITYIMKKGYFLADKFPKFVFNDPKYMYMALDISYKNFEFFSERLKTNKELVTDLVLKHPMIFYEAAKYVEFSRDIILNISKNTNKVYGRLKEEDKNDDNFVSQLIDQNPEIYLELETEKKYDDKFTKKVLESKNGLNIEKKSEFVIRYEKDPKLNSSLLYTEIALLIDIDLLIYTNPRIFENSDKMYELVKINYSAYKFSSKNLKSIFDFSFKCLDVDGEVYRYFEGRMLKDYGLLKKAIESWPMAMLHTNVKIENYPELFGLIPGDYLFMIQDYPRIIRSNSEIMLNLIKNNKKAYRYVDSSLKEDEEFQRKVKEINPDIEELTNERVSIL